MKYISTLDLYTVKYRVSTPGHSATYLHIQHTGHVHQWDPGSILCRAFFFFFFLIFFFSSHLSPRLAFLFFPSFFCPPLISSSAFPLPSFLFIFLLFFSHSFAFFFYFLFPPFCSFSFSLSSLYFIFLISSNFSSPLSFSLFFLRSHKMTTFCGLYIAMTDQTGF